MHSVPGTYEWALCEDDKVRIGPDIHRELEIQDSEVVKIWQGLLDDLGFLLEDLERHGTSSLSIAVCIYLNTCTPGQLGKTWAYMKKATQWTPESQAKLEPPALFEELKRALCDEKDKKSHVARALKRLDAYIASKRTLQGRHTSTRFTAIRLTKAKAEEHAQYTSSAHLLQWVPSSTLDEYRQGEIMRALRYLQIEGYLNEEEPPVPRADLKKKKTRAVGKQSTSHDMMSF